MASQHDFDLFTSASCAYDFAIVNAFTHSPFGGNPAAVCFLDAPFPDAETYLKVAANFNQSMACFVYPATEAEATGAGPGDGAPEETETFRIRWFTGPVEPPLCGHGALAAAHALFARPTLVPPEVRVLRFLTIGGHYVHAQRLPAYGNMPERVEVQLPMFDPVPVSNAEFQRVKKVVAKAWRKKDVAVKYVGVSGSWEKGSEVYVLIELDASEDLEGTDVDKMAFVGTAPYFVNIITAASSKPGVVYDTRMFAPRAGAATVEDHVCGSANCLMAPYWANKLGLASNDEMFAKQVSKRGGDLWVDVDREKRKVTLRGEAKLTADGRVFV
ncbi:Diaminopimelate epimerase-like protein [Phellopilus nigrolimitatus]|nr:Diaminopimelate epimerase-like protein [Phellopilus nigrolimitatus]